MCKKYNIKLRSTGEALENFWDSPEGMKKKTEYSKKIDKENSPFFSIDRKGKNNPRWKDKIETTCDFCGKTLMLLPRLYKPFNMHFCHHTCKGNWMSLNLCLNKNSNWLGGKSFEPYSPGWTKTYKEQIRDQDNHTCQLCGKTEKDNGQKLDVHHIDYNKKNLDPKDLISLCKGCHLKTNFNRKYWKNILLTNIGYKIK